MASAFPGLIRNNLGQGFACSRPPILPKLRYLPKCGFRTQPWVCAIRYSFRKEYQCHTWNSIDKKKWSSTLLKSKVPDKRPSNHTFHIWLRSKTNYLSPIMMVLAGSILCESLMASNMNFSGLPKIVASLPDATSTALMNAPVPEIWHV